MATPALALVKAVGLLEREKDVDMSTPEDVAARAADSMEFLSDVERKAREACNYEVSDAYQNAWLVIRDQRATIERLEREVGRLRAALLLVQRTDRESIAELRPFMGGGWQPDRAVMDVVDAALEEK